MPCRSDYLEPNARERESVRVQTLLAELGLYSPDGIDPYGNATTLDVDTRTLCDACKALGQDVKLQSLELQIWWRDHQIADKKREAKEASQSALEKLVATAEAKLTKEELDALLDLK